MQTKTIPNITAVYDLYKEDHANNHTKEFLREHEYDMWFLEKYSPSVKYANFQKIVERAKKVEVSDDYIDPNHLTLVYKSVPTWVSSDMILF